MQHEAEQDDTGRKPGTGLQFARGKMDGALRDLGDRGAGLAWLWSPEGLTVVECAEPVPFGLGPRRVEVDVEHGGPVDDVPPAGWCA